MTAAIAQTGQARQRPHHPRQRGAPHDPQESPHPKDRFEQLFTLQTQKLRRRPTRHPSRTSSDVTRTTRSSSCQRRAPEGPDRVDEFLRDRPLRELEPRHRLRRPRSPRVTKVFKEALDEQASAPEKFRKSTPRRSRSLRRRSSPRRVEITFAPHDDARRVDDPRRIGGADRRRRAGSGKTSRQRVVRRDGAATGNGPVYPALRALHADQDDLQLRHLRNPAGIALYKPRRKTGRAGDRKAGEHASCRRHSIRCRASGPDTRSTTSSSCAASTAANPWCTAGRRTWLSAAKSRKRRQSPGDPRRRRCDGIRDRGARPRRPFRFPRSAVERAKRRRCKRRSPRCRSAAIHRRIATVTNDKVFDEPVYNYTQEFPYIWDEIRLPVRYAGRPAKAEQILLEAAREHALTCAADRRR